MNLNNKKVFIAPHTPRTTMFKSELKNSCKDIHILGFIDKIKEDEGIYKLNDIVSKEYDYILILSQNHFDSIYKDYKKLLPAKKLIKVDIKNNKYLFFNYVDILKENIKKIPVKIKFFIFEKLVKYFDKKDRKKIVFLNKSFISTNNKALYVYCIENKLDVMLLIDNEEQYKILKKNNLPVARLNSLSSFFYLASAKMVIQDQGNSNYLLPFLSVKQKTIQIWHGIPLKRMNLLVGHVYDYFVGTSKYVNDTSLSAVIQAKEYTDYGYPRNDLLLKDHSKLDLLFCDEELYELSEKEKTIVYMPTHRESSSGIGQNKNLVPIDFKRLNKKMKELDTYFIVKFHPFVMQFYEDIKNSDEYSNIKFHSIQGDIYPLLKYADILITDYSSIYFDFLLLDKPIIFFDYDYEEYSSNMNGFVYDYDTCAPGKKVQNEDGLYEQIEEVLKGKDTFKNERETVLDKFFTYKDENSSSRIMKRLNNE
ncbi:MAG: CDP-glycerol glycerophosphotransferase family protein [Arcobacter sp.]|uniref:CDP-glycerol glycerophosphotransferase family protein n=1 Tax=Arcobacter sp. TaxID=1872629 RepID=UPI003AFFCCD2